MLIEPTVMFASQPTVSRFHARVLLVAVLAAMCGAMAVSSAESAEDLSMRSFHPWARFQPGAWKMVRVVTESLDERGVVVSTTTHDTRTVLQAVDDTAATLEVVVTIEVAGKRFENEPQIVRQPLHSEPAAAQLRLRPAGEGSVTIEGRTIPCRVARLEFDGPSNGQKTVTTVHLSENVAPNVLRRESITSDAEGKQIVESLVEVIALNTPWKALGETKNASLVRSTLRNGKGVVVTYAFVSPEVPGGVIAHTSKELDRSGRATRRSTLELIDFGSECEEEPSGLFRLKRRPRLPK